MDRFEGMRAFVRVVEAGSFTKAAEHLGISRTSITQLVQQLEAHLQVKLLHRTTRKVNVTTSGAAYYERIVRLLAELETIESDLSGDSITPRGVLRVDVPSPFANILMLPALPTFHARYPDIQLELGASDRKVDLISERIDCVVRGGKITDDGLVARRIGDLPLGVYAAPSYLARCGRPTHPDELRDGRHRIVQYQQLKNLPYGMVKGQERVALGGPYVVSIDDGNVYLTAGLVGLGVLWLPEYMAEAHLESGALVPLFEDWQVDPIPLYVAYPPNKYERKPLRVFIDWVEALMAQHARPAPGRR